MHRKGAQPNDNRYRINITVKDKRIIVYDNGIGMSASDLRNFFWTIGASGKHTPEALAAGCVGIFGIGGFANFGVCETLEVISQTEDDEHGTLTRLSEGGIRAAGNTIPSVIMEKSDAVKPRGTIVTGYLRQTANVNELYSYLFEFVRFMPIAIHFNGKKVLQKNSFLSVKDRVNITEISARTQEWCEGSLVITGQLFEDKGHTLLAIIESLRIGRETINLKGQIRFENGPIDLFKRGFKLCATQIGSTIGVTGRLDSDSFVPTAGRDSPDAKTTSLLGRIVQLLEKVAVETVLETPERIAQHTRIFKYVIRNGLVGKLGNVKIRLADGSESTLGEIRKRAELGIGVFFGVAQKQALNQIMHTRGNLVVLLSSDRNRQKAEQQYLQQYCTANTFDGMIEFVEYYEELSRFEKVFLSELELNISRSFEIEKVTLKPGKLSEDIPVFLKEHSGGQPPDILVDVRHQEVTKLKNLGYTPILYSLIATFCWEYLGPSLKKWSPRFFGDGALNLELLAKRRSELWILVKDDIGVVLSSGKRQVVTRADVHEVAVGHGYLEQSPQKPDHPRILRIVDEYGDTGTGGYYIRVPDTAYSAYGDLLPPCENRAVVWAGNKITYVISDAVSAAFQYEIRLDELAITEVKDAKHAEGVIELEQSFQEIFSGIYFPIPTPLKPFLVPTGDEEIRLYLHCEWIDMRTDKHWLPIELTP